MTAIFTKPLLKDRLAYLRGMLGVKSAKRFRKEC